MQRELILFAGLHKTGTTSLRKSCMAGRVALEQQGVTYPTFKVGADVLDNHSGILRVMLQGSPRERGPMRDSLARALRANPRALMIAKAVSLLTLEELGELAAWLESEGVTVRVACYVRRLEAWTNSMVAQRVTGAQRQSIAQAVQGFARDGLVRRQLEHLREAFPSTGFYAFEMEGGTVDHALALAGVKLPDIKFANAGGSDADVRRQSVANGGASTTACEGKFALRPDELRGLESLMSGESEWLTQTFGPAFGR